MLELFETLERQMKQHKCCMLVIIAERSGSVPGRQGACMAVGEEGRLWGTIGGGNLEYQASMLGQKLAAQKKNHLEVYDLDALSAAGLGMVCGGRTKVLFYCLDAEDEEDIRLVRSGLEAAKAKKPCRLMLPLEGGKARIEEAEEKTEKPVRGIVRIEGADWYAEPFFYDGKVYIFGAGHLALELVPLLAHLEFRCIVADDRSEFADPLLFPDAERVVVTDFTNMEAIFEINEEDYIVIMTRGHLCDEQSERFALGTKAKYIGVVGSRRKAAYVRRLLSEEGYSPEQLDRVITPVGMAIGAKTPAEIAVSIAGELIACRAGILADVRG